MFESLFPEELEATTALLAPSMNSLAPSPLAPALARLASSNDPPSPLEVTYVRQRVEEMENCVESLKSQLNVLEGRIERCKPILSPIRRLPLEILGEIFVLIP